MTQHYRFDRDGQPVTGRSPIQIFVMSGGVFTAAQKAGTQNALQAFLTQVRVGGLTQLRKAIALPDGTRVEMLHVAGSTSVKVFPAEAKEKKEEAVTQFYGGIVLQLLDAPLGAPIAETAASGTAPGKPGRPSVPFTDDDNTTHVIIQIRRGVSLVDDPIGRDNIRIWRIKDPRIGKTQEIVAPGTNKYLLSYGLSANGGLSTTNDICLCGQIIATPSPPTLPEGAYPHRTTRATPRLVTFGFAPTDFNAPDGPGIAVLAYLNTLYAYDRANPAQAWQLLHLADMPANGPFISEYAEFINDFGSALTYSANGANSTVVCAGSNAAGVCSSFTATVTKNPDGSNTVVGEVVPRPDGGTAEQSAQHTFTAEGVYDGQYLSFYVLDHPHAQVTNASDVRRTRTVSGGMPARYANRSFGGYHFHYQPVVDEHISRSRHNGYLDSWVTFGIGALAYYRHTYQYESTHTKGGVVLEANTLDSLLSSNHVAPFTEWAGYTYSVTKQHRPTEWHTEPLVGALAVRLTYSGTCVEAVTEQNGHRASELGDFLYIDLEGPSTSSLTYSGSNVSREILRARDGAVIAQTTNVAARFDTPPRWALPRTVDTSPAATPPYRFQFVEAPATTVEGTIATSYGPVIQEWAPYVSYASGGAVPDVYPTLMPGAVTPPPPAGPQLLLTHHEFDYGPGVPSDMTPTEYKNFFVATHLDPGNTTLTTLRMPVSSAEGPPVTDEFRYYAEVPSTSAIWYDPRTEGFVIRCVTSDRSETEPYTYTYEYESWIGNDVSIVPLGPVLEAWRNLGVKTALESAKIFPAAGDGWLI